MAQRLIQIMDRRRRAVFDYGMPAPDHRPSYLLEMMQRLGIDPAGGVVAHSGLTYLTALHRCQSCPSKQDCRTWLDSVPMSMSFAPRFCPNGDLLFELQIDQPGHIRGPATELCTGKSTDQAAADAAAIKPDATKV